MRNIEGLGEGMYPLKGVRLLEIMQDLIFINDAF